MSSAQRILVIQTAFLGDAILSIPLLKNIRTKFEKSIIAYVCRSGHGELFSQAKLADQVIEVNKKDKKSIKDAFIKMREFSANIIISPHRSFRTSLWVWRLGADESVGFESLLNFVAFKKTVPYRPDQHDVLRQLSLLEAFGQNNADLGHNGLSVKIEIQENPRFQYLRDFIALSPGSQWNTKRWTLEGFISLGLKFQTLGKKVVILGAAHEMELCLALENALSSSINLCGQTTVFELAQLLKQARLLVCNDSGTMHVATAVETPVVSIFGPTVTSQGYAPWSEKARVVQVDLSCRPCGAHGHKECPLKTHACMKNITSETVFKASEAFLS